TCNRRTLLTRSRFLLEKLPNVFLESVLLDHACVGFGNLAVAVDEQRYRQTWSKSESFLEQIEASNDDGIANRVFSEIRLYLVPSFFHPSLHLRMQVPL